MKICAQVNFWWALALRDIIQFLNFLFQLKNRRSGKNLYKLYFILNRIVSGSSCEKRLLNIANNRKGISKFFSHGFFVIYHYCKGTFIPIWKKILITESGAHRSSNWVNFWQVLKETKILRLTYDSFLEIYSQCQLYLFEYLIALINGNKLNCKH